MNDEKIPSTKDRRRGRPRGTRKAHVIERLLDATDALLQEHSHFDLTERRVAAAAGVDDRMIHYYFRDKDGLIFAVIERYCDSLADSFAKLDAIDEVRERDASDLQDPRRCIFYKALDCQNIGVGTRSQSFAHQGIFHPEIWPGGTGTRARQATRSSG